MKIFAYILLVLGLVLGTTIEASAQEIARHTGEIDGTFYDISISLSKTATGVKKGGENKIVIEYQINPPAFDLLIKLNKGKERRPDFSAFSPHLTLDYTSTSNGWSIKNINGDRLNTTIQLTFGDRNANYEGGNIRSNINVQFIKKEDPTRKKFNTCLIANAEKTLAEVNTKIACLTSLKTNATSDLLGEINSALEKLEKQKIKLAEEERNKRFDEGKDNNSNKNTEEKVEEREKKRLQNLLHSTQLEDSLLFCAGCKKADFEIDAACFLETKYDNGITWIFEPGEEDCEVLIASKKFENIHKIFIIEKREIGALPPPREIVDTTGTNIEDGAKENIKVVADPTFFEQYQLYIIGGGVFLLCLLLLGFFRKKPKQASSEETISTPLKNTTKPATNQAISTIGTPTTREEPSLDDLISIEEVSEEEEPIIAANSMDLGKHIPIDMKACWRDTAVTKVHFKQKSVQDIAVFLEREYPILDNVVSGRMTKEDIEALPEIGGFLLGRVFPKNSDSFEISVDEFIPITPELHDPYTVKFGDKAWVELHDAQQEFPDLKLIGWFHTHPDHGVFLSNADIVVQRQVFQKKYQIALEIDPVKKGKDMGIFTWKSKINIPNLRKGEAKAALNNTSARLMNAWWRFDDLVEKTKNK